MSQLQAQFKAAEANGVPLAIILGEDELKAGKAKLKQMGLPDGHPEKEGVMIDMADIVTEVKKAITRLDQNTTNGFNGVVQGVGKLGI